jgi:hypothetical protein
MNPETTGKKLVVPATPLGRSVVDVLEVILSITQLLLTGINLH